jgi:hypothetical protein
MKTLQLTSKNETDPSIKIFDEIIIGSINDNQKFCIDAEAGRMYDLFYLMNNYKFPYNTIGKQFELVTEIIEDYGGVAFYPFEYLDF